MVASIFIREEEAEILEPIEEEKSEEDPNAANFDAGSNQTDADLRAEVGEPVVIGKDGFIKINQNYFIYRFSLEHRVLSETIEQAGSQTWAFSGCGVHPSKAAPIQTNDG
jgi:hypothetical protein